MNNLINNLNYLFVPILFFQDDPIHAISTRNSAGEIGKSPKLPDYG